MNSFLLFQANSCAEDGVVLVKKYEIGIEKTALETLGEFGLIDKLTSQLYRKTSGIVLGVGDDTAAILPTRGQLMLVTCDSQIEDIHFKFDWSSPFDVGRRAAAVNLSDIAAMGGKPRFALVSLAVPKHLELSTLTEIYRGLDNMFSERRVSIIGGNTAATVGPLVVDITLLGEAKTDRLLTRDGARIGDVVCVTGTLGNARAGLAVLSSPNVSWAGIECDSVLGAYRCPTPRGAVGKILGEFGHVSACMDISDGLAGDAGHLARRSEVCIRIDLMRLPISDTVRQIASNLGESVEIFALRGGEDFELLFTLPKEELPALSAQVAEKTGVSVSVVGEVVSGSGVELTFQGQDIATDDGGFDHFRQKNIVVT